MPIWSYSDNDYHYNIILNHDMGFNNSKWLKIMIENLFKTYGVKAEIRISERSVFINVFKNS